MVLLPPAAARCSVVCIGTWFHSRKDGLPDIVLGGLGILVSDSGWCLLATLSGRLGCLVLAVKSELVMV